MEVGLRDGGDGENDVRGDGAAWQGGLRVLLGGRIG